MANPKTKSRREAAPQPAAPKTNASRIFPFLAGIWLALVFAKFGNPVIFGELIERPAEGVEFLIDPWPFSWGYCMLAVVSALGFALRRSKPLIPTWLLILPLVWFGWQLASARLTVNRHLTEQTLMEFAACILCFFFGLISLSQFRNSSPLWFGLALGLVFSLWVGLRQHFGGLEQMRHFLEGINWDLYPPQMKTKLTSPEFQQKIASDRIFGTFVYPNALAGGIILALPASLLGLWNICARLSFIVRGVLVGTVGYLGLACLFWSGSKAGWLIVLGMGLTVFLHLENLGNRVKTIAVVLLLVAGLAGFYEKHSSYFTKKNNSAAARMDYWRAAWQMLKERPIFGSGPGTFMVGYQRLKAPEAESTKLAHNDYLQQGSDSGIVGMCSYAAFIAGSIILLYRRLRQNWDWMRFAVWLGVAGLAVQEMVEFSLYIPALAWPFFLFLGWLWGTAATDAEVLKP